MSIPANIFTGELGFDPGAQPTEDFDAFLKLAPARWVVVLLADELDRPVQLLCVKNLRACLKRRLGGDETIGLSRRVDYRQIVRRIHYRRVDSAFEADVVYLEAARAIFPESYQGMTGFRPAWFVHVNPDTAFPRYVKTTDLSITTGQLIGPVEDKHAANKLVDDVADWFDLCRYYSILIQAPNALACAYKEMGKCPAPCDGSISMAQYRHLIDWSARSIVEPAELIRDHTRRMRQAASEQRFETAGRIKAYVDSLSQLGKGVYRHARRLEDFQYLSLQRGPVEGTARIFLITPTLVEEFCCLPFEPTRPAEILRQALDRANSELFPGSRSRPILDLPAAERVGVVTHHLFQAKKSHGVFLALDQADEKAIVRAYRELLKQKFDDADENSEGVVKELQSMSD